MNKKQLQLGMNPSTASNRLVKDILYSLVVKTGQNNCCKCSFPMSRETFSIEHVVAWLDSDNPKSNFFDLNNISFSHLKCNMEDRRYVKTTKCGSERKYTSGCRCDLCKDGRSARKKAYYTPERRREQYLTNGT